MNDGRRSFVLTPRWGGWRTTFFVLFMTWGAGGFFWIATEAWARLIGVPAGQSIGIGTSGYVTALALIWIGGMAFFGGAAAIFRDPVDVTDVTPESKSDVRAPLPRTAWQEEDDRRAQARDPAQPSL